MEDRDGESFKKRIFEASPMPIVVAEADTGRMIECNPAAVAIYGYAAREDLLGKTPTDVSAPVQYDGSPSAEKVEYYGKKARDEGSVCFQWKQIRPNGEYWDADVHLLAFEAGGREYFQFSLIDITSRLRAERINGLLHDLMIELNSSMNLREGIHAVLEAALRIEGLDSGGVYVSNPADGSMDLMTYSGLSEDFARHVSHLAKDSPTVRMISDGACRYGRYEEIRAQHDLERDNEGLKSIAMIPVMDKGKLIAVMNAASHTLDDIPDEARETLETIAYQVGGSLLRMRSEEELAKEKDFIEKILDGLPVLFCLFDEGLRLRGWNERFAEYFDGPEGILDGCPLDGLRRSAAAAAISAAVGKDWQIRMECPLTGRDGEERHHLLFGKKFDSGFGPMLMIVGIDVTEQKKAEAENEALIMRLAQSQKLESLGLFAGGLAHDFNNLLGGIYGFIDLATAASGENRSDLMGKALGTIDRARSLTGQLLTFAKGGEPVKKIEELMPFLRETVEFALAGSPVSCAFEGVDALWPCEIDRNQIGQVMDNLVINAVQAMPNGGSIMISAGNASLGPGGHPILPPGDYAIISVRDTGTGIPAEHLGNIFDPFFTTKAKGHGLGLATCYSIAKRHGGCLDVESEIGKGSVFRLYLPAKPGAKMEGALSPVPDAAKSQAHGEIIVMDDEEVLREALAAMLDSYGFAVTAAENGEGVVALVKERIASGSRVEGFIFDLTVPGGMGGKETLAAVRALGCEAPAFVASGYGSDPIMAMPEVYGFAGSIGKPFRMKELAELISRHLGG